ncbi:hypothetical protein [Mycolicibacter hiberniae]|uniref:Uncharacterized protein n=1 Tax=Mycolicibacter hiberniae TaxID=29314 RepID=A0A7I7X8E3_9MYCO|nr:hypothetical protein [Mycolicibacter hiberniae]MCV7087188.1 hypothetical protein [Mycolicibacter hiberniae]ORV67817.1 hypothetical protein AWC09_16810 [Mycolicibacter hiberniae]BBZ25600.1 hypothetical protein MHIB_40180 [Mycolicibacter hiberniae]
MTGPKPDPRDVETRPISVAELLAKNGTIGSPPVSGRRRRRRGNADAVTVAELTGEIPIIRDTAPPETEAGPPAAADGAPSGALPLGPAPGFVEDDRPPTGPRPAQRAEPARRPVAEPRWPKSPPQLPQESGRPEQSEYPRPLRRRDPVAAPDGPPAEIRPTGSGAEGMRPDPVDTYTDIAVDVMDADVRDAGLPSGDSAFVRSFLTKGGSAGRAVQPAREDEGADEATVAAQAAAGEEAAEDYAGRPGLVGAALVVLQSILAVAFGGGLFIAFDQLWQWNSIVALVLTVLVTLGLVAAVQVVRKTSDIVSTLIAVAVGLLVTLGPLALHAN